MKVGDRVHDFQGAVEGHGVGRVISLYDGWATVAFANTKADIPLDHLVVVNDVIVHFVNEEGDQTTFGPFASDTDALAWCDGRRLDHPTMGGHFTIDRLSAPSTWDSKS